MGPVRNISGSDSYDMSFLYFLGTHVGKSYESNDISLLGLLGTNVGNSFQSNDTSLLGLLRTVVDNSSKLDDTLLLTTLLHWVSGIWESESNDTLLFPCMYIMI